MDDVLEEAAFVTLIAIFSFIFHQSLTNPVIYLSFTIASLAFLYVDHVDHFGIAALAFTASLFIIDSGFVGVTASTGVIFFSLGLHEHVHRRIG